MQGHSTNEDVKTLIEGYMLRKAGYRPVFNPIPDPYYGPEIILAYATTIQGDVLAINLYTDSAEAIYNQLVQTNALWFRLDLFGEIVFVAGKMATTNCLAELGELTEDSKQKALRLAKQGMIDLLMTLPISISKFEMRLKTDAD